MLDWVELIGFAGTGLTLAAWAMKCSRNLRLAGVASSVAFLLYGFLTGSWPVVATEAVLLPLNVYRLWELTALRRRAETGRLDDIDWILPHSMERRVRAGETIVGAGEAATSLVVLRSGRVVSSGGASVGGPLLGDALPFCDGRRHRRTLIAETDVILATAQISALEKRALGDPLLCRQMMALAVASLQPGDAAGTALAEATLQPRLTADTVPAT